MSAMTYEQALPLIEQGFHFNATEAGLVQFTPEQEAEWAAWRAAQVPTLAELKAAKHAAIVAAYDAVIASGYPWTAPGGASETLQVREHDRSNWLGLKDSCNEAIAAGLGDDPCPLPIRCTSNARYNLTFSETVAIMRDLRTWLSQVLAVLWAKKDACRDATTQAELDAINPATGWPD